MSTKKAKFEFDEALGELEGLVERLEQGEMSMEESLKEFERGVQLTRQCQESLKQAEQRVAMLNEDDPDQLDAFE